MITKIGIKEIVEQCPGITISVGAAELGKFSKQLIAESRREFERERAAIEAGITEVYREPEDVKAMLNISESTLYRMAKSKILEPVWVAGLKRFRQSDIDKLIQNTKA